MLPTVRLQLFSPFLESRRALLFMCPCEVGGREGATTTVVSEQGDSSEKSGCHPESEVQVRTLGRSLPFPSDPPADVWRCIPFLHAGFAQINDRSGWQRWAEGKRIMGV